MPDSMDHGLSIYDWPVHELSFSEYVNEKLFVSQCFGPRETLGLPIRL